MRHNINYAEYFEEKVTALTNYVKEYNLEALVLGISGGIDSTVCAAICYEVTKRVPVKFIGRSLPTHFNKKEETTSADLVGNAFCYDYKEVNIFDLYYKVNLSVNAHEVPVLSNTSNVTNILVANGNIQARLRMIYLYNLSSIHKGIVIDTDNLTEHNLGYFTIHGDQGDVNPIGDLWKTQVFELAEWLQLHYASEESNSSKVAALEASLQLKPTAGLGITNNDLEEIGAESYDQVDGILQEILAWKWLSKKRGDFPERDLKEQREMFLDEQQMLDTPIEVILNVVDRHFKSEFKRKKLPIVL
ncbi:MAG: NAD(+) synthase [Erysipelotrichaceae bacterium]|nr:NAD(+) synthase [Erysipelotrichaceae bacterium]